nr:hypothetical protein [Tanacetum cinerariifolium]
LKSFEQSPIEDGRDPFNVFMDRSRADSSDSSPSSRGARPERRLLLKERVTRLVILPNSLGICPTKSLEERLIVRDLPVKLVVIQADVSEVWIDTKAHGDISCELVSI